jgi:hypothetical protein
MGRFLRAYARSGVVLTGSQAAGVARSTFYDWQAKYPEFAIAAGEAREAAADRLEQEMLRRATTGDRQPIYQGAKLVGYRRQRSDNLLMFALKGARPGKYKDKLLDSADLVTLLQRIRVAAARIRGDVVEAEPESTDAAVTAFEAPPPSTGNDPLEPPARASRSLLAAVYAGARRGPTPKRKE